MAVGRFLGRPGRVRAFNVAMALLLVLSLYPILAENLGGGGERPREGRRAAARVPEKATRGPRENGAANIVS